MSCQKQIKSKLRVKKSKTRKHRGGSYASKIVMDASKGPAVMNDFVADPRVRDGPNADYMNLGISTGNQTGGSAASDMTMENLSDIATTDKYVEGWKVSGDINSLNTYQPSGGKRNLKSRKSKSRKSKSRKSKSRKSKSRKSKSRKSKSKNNKNRNHNHNHVIKGGSSDYMASYYSLDSNIARPNFAWDPPTRDSAGSGSSMGPLEGANVSHMGAPLV